MEVCLFAKKEIFFIAKITEYRDGAGFPFKTIEIDRVSKPKSPPQIQPQKEGPVLTMGTKNPALSGAPNKQIASDSKQHLASDPKKLSSNADKKLAARDVNYLPAGKK
ncbi:MAG: hypothetical protein LBE57_07235 [Methanosarcinales archaeon]|nr:hypothetical protein [Methanosarcinales archaeon]